MGGIGSLGVMKGKEGKAVYSTVCPFHENQQYLGIYETSRRTKHSNRDSFPSSKTDHLSLRFRRAAAISVSSQHLRVSTGTQHSSRQVKRWAGRHSLATQMERMKIGVSLVGLANPLS